MSLMTIPARFTGSPVESDDANNRSVLSTLKIIYEGGSADGKAADLRTRNLSSVVIGFHRGNLHFFETYKRTIWVNLRNRRTIFRCVGSTVRSNNSNWWGTLLANLHIRKLKTIII